MSLNSALLIQDYVISCHLGVSPEEREVPQEVRASLRIEFQAPPDACLSDAIEDTVCYAKLCEDMHRMAASKSFKTVEHLSQMLSEVLQKSIPKGSKWRLRIHKVNPPVPGLINGACFEIGTLN